MTTFGVPSLAGKRIAITGARGYIATALREALSATACHIELVSRTHLEAPQPSQATISVIVGDLRKPDVWRGLVDKCDVIFHLSGQTNLRWAEAHRDDDHAQNVLPIEAFREAVTGAPAKPRLVFASTATIVGLARELPVTDRTPDCPITVYDQHKLQCEDLLRSCALVGLAETCSLRLANVYGHGALSVNPGRGILDAMIRRAVAGQTLTLYGDGSYIRDFIFIDDVVKAFLCAATQPKTGFGDHFLVASGEAVTLRAAFETVAEAVHHLTGQKSQIDAVPEPDDLHPIERRNFVGDSSRFSALTGWKPEASFKTGVKKAVSNFQQTTGGVC